VYTGSFTNPGFVKRFSFAIFGSLGHCTAWYSLSQNAASGCPNGILNLGHTFLLIHGSSQCCGSVFFGPPGSGSVIILYGSGSFHQQAKK
jgi:hypothetical protein